MGKTQHDLIASPRPKLIAATILALLISYALGSWAINSGSYWEYAGCILFLIVALKCVIYFIKPPRQ